MEDPVQNQDTHSFSACSFIVSSLPGQDIWTGHYKLGCGFCSRPIMLAVLGVQNKHVRCFGLNSVVRFV